LISAVISIGFKTLSLPVRFALPLTWIITTIVLTPTSPRVDGLFLAAVETNEGLAHMIHLSSEDLSEKRPLREEQAKLLPVVQMQSGN
jgi:hypothetical protein